MLIRVASSAGQREKTKQNKTILSPHKESNVKPLGFAFQCSTTEPKSPYDNQTNAITSFISEQHV